MKSLTRIKAGIIAGGHGYMPLNVGPTMEAFIQEEATKFAGRGVIGVVIDAIGGHLEFTDDRQDTTEHVILPRDHIIVEQDELFELVPKAKLVPKYSHRFWGNPK